MVCALVKIHIVSATVSIYVYLSFAGAGVGPACDILFEQELHSTGAQLQLVHVVSDFFSPNKSAFLSYSRCTQLRLILSRRAPRFWCKFTVDTFSLFLTLKCTLRCFVFIFSVACDTFSGLPGTFVIGATILVLSGGLHFTVPLRANFVVLECAKLLRLLV